MFRFEIILGRSRRQDEPFHPEQGGHIQKFSAAMLHINGAHGQCQRFLVLPHGNKTGTQVADKVHVEHFVMLSVKLCQGSLQQRYPAAEIILKEQPLTS